MNGAYFTICSIVQLQSCIMKLGSCLYESESVSVAGEVSSC